MHEYAYEVGLGQGNAHACPDCAIKNPSYHHFAEITGKVRDWPVKPPLKDIQPATSYTLPVAHPMSRPLGLPSDC